MKIILFSRRQISHNTEELQQIFDAIHLFGFEYAVNEEFAPIVEASVGIEIPPQNRYADRVDGEPDSSIMVCYGGDGTLLEGVHRLHGAAIPLIGINSGHLGFLTSAPTAGISQIFNDIFSDNIKLEARSMLEVGGDFTTIPDSVLALNEFSIQRHGAGMISVETYVDRQMVATYHGDGVLVCTPTGSTAYSLSVGGPVVAPQCACLVISPLAPHNLTMRPVVVPDSSKITMRIRARHTDPFISLDNRIYCVKDGSVFTVKRAENKIFLAVPHNISFYDTLRDKMMWGVDIRS
ncbi:MAG: NAD(+)/NADH kinase [Alistipes sp.]